MPDQVAPETTPPDAAKSSRRLSPGDVDTLDPVQQAELVGTFTVTDLGRTLAALWREDDRLDQVSLAAEPKDAHHPDRRRKALSARLDAIEETMTTLPARSAVDAVLQVAVAQRFVCLLEDQDFDVLKANHKRLTHRLQGIARCLSSALPVLAVTLGVAPDLIDWTEAERMRGIWLGMPDAKAEEVPASTAGAGPATGGASIPAAADGPDAELIRRCAEYLDIEDTIYHRGRDVPEGDPLHVRQEEALNRLCELRATTIHGLKARGRVVRSLVDVHGETGPFWEDRATAALLDDIDLAGQPT